MNWSRKPVVTALYSCWLQAVLQAAATGASTKVVNGTVNGNIFLAVPTVGIAERIQTVEWKYATPTGPRSIAKLLMSDKGNQTNYRRLFGDYSDRAYIHPNGSLSFQNARLNDSGKYSCITTDENGEESIQDIIVYVFVSETAVTKGVGWNSNEESNLTYCVKTNETDGYPMINCAYIGAFTGTGVLVIIAISIWASVRYHRKRSSRQGKRSKGERSHRNRGNQNDDIYENMGRIPQ